MDLTIEKKTVDPQLDFDVIYDNGKILCFVGIGFTNTTLSHFFGSQRSTELWKFEDIPLDPAWYQQRQFMVSSSNLGFKKQTVQHISALGGEFFSVVAGDNHIGYDVKIGRGSVVKDYNTLLDGATVGNHTTITHYVTMSHESSIGDYCHIGPYTYTVYSDIGSLNYVGIRSSFLGNANKNITVVDGCNFIIGSQVTKAVLDSGTYHGNRRLDQRGSLDHRIY